MIWKIGSVTVTGTASAAINQAVWQFGDDVGDIKAWAVNEINRIAGDARTSIGTDIPFQGDVYQLKEIEAKAFATDNAPDETKYPVLYAEATARQMLPADLAAEYLYNAQAWPVLLGQIEAMRMGAITAISAAISVADIEAVLAGLEVAQ